MLFRRRAIALTVASLVALSGCAAHNAGVLPSASLPQAAFERDAGSAATAPVTFTFLTAPNPEPDGIGAKHQRFIAWSTKSVQIDAYKPNSAHVAKNLLSTTFVEIGAGKSNCKASPGNTRMCTATVKLTAPSVDLVMTSWDLDPAGGRIPSTAKQLGFGSIANQTVAAGTKVKVALGGIPKAFELTLSHATVVKGEQVVSMHGVVASDQTMDLKALDADGNIILTDAYVTAAGQPAPIAMQVRSSHASCGSAKLSIGTGTPSADIDVRAPVLRGITFEYGATAIATPFTTAGACSFSVRAGFDGTYQSGRYVLLGPQITEYPISGTIVEPISIVRGADGNMWWTDFNFVGKINVSTKAMTQYPLSSPQGIVSASDGNLWISSYGTLSKMSTSGSVLNTYTWNASGDQPSQQLAIGPDGNFWIPDATSSNPARKLVKVTPTGTVTAYTPRTSGAYLGGITAGADGDMWFSEFNVAGISSMEKISTEGTNAVQYGVTGYAQYPGFAIQGPDKNVWFTSCAGRSINKITTAGAVTSFQPASMPQAWGLATGPDGAIWFSNLTNGTGALLRIPTNATSSSQITSFPVPKKGGVYWMATGPDGALWFTEFQNNNPNPSYGWIGRMSL